jgi:hypothetical protein
VPEGAAPVPAETILLEETDDQPDPPNGLDTPDAHADKEWVEPVDSSSGQPVPAPSGRAHAEPDPPIVWLNVGLMQEATLVSGENVCSPESQMDGEYVCLRESGSQYYGTPMRGDAGSVAPRIRFATTRVVGAAFLPLGAMSVGVRAGWAFAGQGPRPAGGHDFLPLLVEGQAAYWVGGRAFRTSGIDLFVLATGGVAQIDSRATVQVAEDTAISPPPHQLDNPAAQSLQAYRRSGPGFAGAGLGLFVPTASRTGLVLDLRGIGLFPTPGAAVSLAASLALGL